MAPSAGAQKMNIFLKQRRQKLNKVNKYRTGRIFKNYIKAKQNYDHQIQQKIVNNKQDHVQIIKNQDISIKRQNQLKHQTGNKIVEQVKPVDSHNQRKINFYNQIFGQSEGQQTHNKLKKKKKSKTQKAIQNALPVPKVDEATLSRQKLQKLKNRKVKFIKKMQTQKTPRGQPVMKNMIKYALTKIQQGMVKDKLEKLNNQKKQQKQANQKNRWQNKQKPTSFNTNKAPYNPNQQNKPHQRPNKLNQKNNNNGNENSYIKNNNHSKNKYQ